MDSLSEIEIRILGTLVEKSMATPEYYPLTLKALRAGCNQATNRAPVTDYSELDIELGIKSLKLKGLSHFIEPKGGNEVRKYEHSLFEEHRWGLSRGQVALLAVLLLRGEQTASELRSRVIEKMIDLSPQQVEEALLAMAAMEEPCIVKVPRQPGQRESRWRNALSPMDREASAQGSVGAMDDFDLSQPSPVSFPISREEFDALLRRVSALEQRLGMESGSL